MATEWCLLDCFAESRAVMKPGNDVKLVYMLKADRNCFPTSSQDLILF